MSRFFLYYNPERTYNFFMECNRPEYAWPGLPGDKAGALALRDGINIL